MSSHKKTGYKLFRQMKDRTLAPKNNYGKVGDSYEAKLAAQDMLEYLLDLYWRCKVR